MPAHRPGPLELKLSPGARSGLIDNQSEGSCHGRQSKSQDVHDWGTKAALTSELLIRIIHH
ncbi:hypothetical protein PCASD_24146, partial [Puccinia coronata f. sp. avenae]